MARVVKSYKGCPDDECPWKLFMSFYDLDTGVTTIVTPLVVAEQKILEHLEGHLDPSLKELGL